MITPRTKRVLRVTFGIIGTRAAVLGVVTLGGSLVLRFVLHAGDTWDGSNAGVAYLGLALVSVAVVRRTKTAAVAVRAGSAGA